MSVPVTAAFIEAAIFAAAAIVNLTGMRWARLAYERWDIPAGVYRTLGVIELAAAVFLIAPETRLWGIVIAAPIIFGSVVILLENRHYFYAMPVVALMALLLATTLAVPHRHQSLRYAAASTAGAAASHFVQTNDQAPSFLASPANS